MPWAGAPAVAPRAIVGTAGYDAHVRCVSIITGALGSGKTTLLNHWLRHERLARSLVIVNEMGEIGLDHLLVAAPSDNARVLRNGCLCCEVRGEFVQTLLDVAGMQADGRIPAFERILVETTGMAGGGHAGAVDGARAPHGAARERCRDRARDLH